MMCDPCRMGGDMNASARFESAIDAHLQCVYPNSCTCQHGVGPQWVRP